jgi:hypothetical protein
MCINTPFSHAGLSLAWTCALVAAGFGFGNVPDKLGALGDDHLAIGLARFRGRGGHEISRLFFYASTGCESLAFTASRLSGWSNSARPSGMREPCCCSRPVLQTYPLLPMCC